MKDGREKRALARLEHRKAGFRAKVKRPFCMLERQFGLVKMRFRGLAKDTAHVITLFALSNRTWHADDCWRFREHFVRSWRSERETALRT